MVVGVLTVHLHLPWARSLKDRRSAVRGALERIRRRFNVSVAEVDLQGRHKEALLAFACAARDESGARRTLEAVRLLLEENGGLELASSSLDFFRPQDPLPPEAM